MAACTPQQKRSRKGRELPEPTDELRRRFRSRYLVDQRSGCWEWAATKVNDGYGLMSWRGVSYLAHRLAYRIHVGRLDPNQTIDHLCRNRSCVNPLHLQQVPLRENLLRGEAASSKNARKTHCLRGHPFDDENTRFYPQHGSRRLRRFCLACGRMRDAAAGLAAGAGAALLALYGEALFVVAGALWPW